MPNEFFSVRSDGGVTLLELAVVMALLGLGIAHLIPAARSQIDRMAVTAAREETAALFHRARGEAVARGQAEVLLSASPARAELLAGSDTLERSHLGKVYGVALTLSRGKPGARLAFGPMGLGWVSSQTLRFSRGNAETLLVVSSLGRVARR